MIKNGGDIVVLPAAYCNLVRHENKHREYNSIQQMRAAEGCNKIILESGGNWHLAIDYALVDVRFLFDASR